MARQDPQEPVLVQVALNNLMRPLKDFTVPKALDQPSCITLPRNNNDFEIKSGTIHLLPQFYGKPGEDPHIYIKDFFVVCAIILNGGMSDEEIRLRLFPFSLKERAKEWLYSLPRLLDSGRIMVDTTSGGGLMNKNALETREIFEILYENSQQFNYQRAPLKKDDAYEPPMQYQFTPQQSAPQPPPRQGVLIEEGFVQSASNHCLFTKSVGKVFIALLVYVDDIIIASNDKKTVDNLKRSLDNKFKLKDLGDLKYFLGLEVARSDKGIYVSQRNYALQLVDDMGYLGCKPVKTPMEPNMKLSQEDGELLDDLTVYRRMIGKLLYLTITRPDLTFSVNQLS
ncbi:hypothetical protein EZV62_027460 [Acer yangbiense]|uniref:Reverse transcriptase Ty1/copia-type domain-containing protein n=1 Tax=Acer yangbiense TaxID=1000413 RepID=A0A5C7GVM0_9ROSI|nr:hypothetical protein EZV62_027460 [Acer yangbiense]